MAYAHTFGTGTQWTSGWLDDNFTAAGLLGTIPCTITGTNTLTLTPRTTPTLPTPPLSLQQGLRVSAFAANTNSGAVTANVGGTGSFNVYKDSPSGPIALTGNEIVQNNYIILIYDVTLNTGSGGYHLNTSPASAAGTVTSVATGAGLTGGPVTTTGTIAFASVSDSRVLANVSGGSAVPSANTLTAILDHIMSNTQGSILARGSSVWAANTESTWTPSLQFGGAAVGMTYSTQLAYYMTVGYLVVGVYQITLTAKGSSTGNATISLPVAAGGGSRVGGGLILNYSNFTSITTTPWSYVSPSATTASLLIAGSATVSNVTEANFANNTSLGGIFVYFSG